jgi:hypothetical protein
VLMFRGHRLQPSIKGNDSLNLGRPFHGGAREVVLITDNGGTACPFLYYFVTLSKSGAQATRYFGTCNAVISVKQKEESIPVSMHGYRGPFEPDEERKRAARAKLMFLFFAMARSKRQQACERRQSIGDRHAHTGFSPRTLQVIRDLCG